MLWASYIEGFLRSIMVAAACTIFGYCGAASFSFPRRLIRSFAWFMAVLCFFAPPLLTGYAYADFTGVVRWSDAFRCSFYAALMCARITPVAAVIWMMCPRQISAESWFCLRLAWPQLSVRNRIVHVWQMLRNGVLASVMVAFCVAFLLLFSEFELASFLGVRQWTIGVFDAQVGGMPLGESLLRVLFPVAVSGLLAAFVILMVKGRQLSSCTDKTGARGRYNTLLSWIGFCCFAGGALLVAVIPACIVFGGALAGMLRVGSSFALQLELASSLFVAVSASVLACALARRVLSVQGSPARVSGPKFAGLLLLLLPGLLGGLVLGLCILVLFQLPLAWRLRETPLPLILAATFLVMPAALLMQQLLGERNGTSDVHLARLLSGSSAIEVRRSGASISWVRSARPGFWMMALLLCLVFYDITLSTLLAPVRMPLVMPRLYNFMHYGRSQILSASLVVCVLAPIVSLAIGGFVYRFWRVRHAANLES